MSYWFGSFPIPHPGDPQGRLRCSVRRHPGVYVLVSTATAKLLAPYDLYLDKAGRVVTQNVKNQRRPLSDLGTYELRRDVQQVPR